METILFPFKGRLKMDETDPLLKVSHPAAGNPGGELLKEKLLKENSSIAKSRQAKGKSFVVAVGCLLVVFLIFIPLITQQKGIYTLSVLGNEDYGLPPAMFDYPWATSHLAVVEPYRLTTIKANNGMCPLGMIMACQRCAFFIVFVIVTKLNLLLYFRL